MEPLLGLGSCAVLALRLRLLSFLTASTHPPTLALTSSSSTVCALSGENAMDGSAAVVTVSRSLSRRLCQFFLRRPPLRPLCTGDRRE